MVNQSSSPGHADADDRTTVTSPPHGHDHDGHDHDGLDTGAGIPHVHGAGLAGKLRELFRPHSHDPADTVDGALEASTEGIRAVKLSLLGLGVTALLQLVIYVASGSVALLADTIHNFSDALTAVPLWIAFRLGRRAHDERFTYGYGRAEDLAGLFIVAMIALSAGLAAWEAIGRFIEPRAVDHVWWVVGAGVVGALGNELVARYRIGVGRRIGSAALVADGLHARTDSLTSVAVALGAVGVALGFPLADPIVGLGIAGAIVLVLNRAARDIFGRLMDRVDPAIVRRMREVVTDVDGVDGVDALRVRWVGNQLRAEVDVRSDGRASLAAAHGVANAVEHALLHAVPRLRAATVHVSPAGDGHHADLLHHDR